MLHILGREWVMFVLLYNDVVPVSNDQFEQHMVAEDKGLLDSTG